MGIIPACAGSTHGEASRLRVTRDHPRMCGEHHEGWKPLRPQTGSSPHVRGALDRRGCQVRGRGIIPACAGSTLRVLPTLYGGGDHPRMCGEHVEIPHGHVGLQGSSPHVRGALAPAPWEAGLPGIIPACAGSTLKYLAFLGYSSAFSFGSQGSKLFTCVVFYPPNFRAL